MGVVQDLDAGLWYDIKPNMHGQSTVTVVRDEDIPESADPYVITKTIKENPEYMEMFDDDNDDDDVAVQISSLKGGVSSWWSSLLSPPEDNSAADNSTRKAPDTFSTLVDALVVWTRNAECFKSGQLPLECTINDETFHNMAAAVDLMVSETNVAYQNSNMDLTLRLAHAQRDPTGYEEKGFPRALLFASTSRTIKALRYEYDADVVMFVVDNSAMSNVAGMAYNNFLTPGKRGWMFAVVGAPYTSLRSVAAHELGHLFGCFHDRGSQNGCTSETKNWGHRDPAGRYATIMSYRCQTNQCDNLSSIVPCPRLPYFAGNVTYHGEILGGSHNNCRGQILATKDLVASIMPRDIATSSLDCFSPLMSVQVHRKGKVAMKDLELGDRVLTASGRYRTVYLMDHHHPSKPTKYLQLHTLTDGINDQIPLELSHFHMVFVEGQSHPIPAKDIRVDDRLQALAGPVLVTKIVAVVREGLYNPLTSDGTIVVNGILASTYAARGGTSHLMIAGRPIVPYQVLLRFLLEPYRKLAEMGLTYNSSLSLLLDDKESIQEVHWFGQLGRQTATWWDQQHAVLQAFVLVVIVLLFTILHLCFNMPCMVVVSMFLVVGHHITSGRNGMNRKKTTQMNSNRTAASSFCRSDLS